MKRLLLLISMLVVGFGYAQESVEQTEPWGWHTIIDLEDCNPAYIKSADHIKNFVCALCDLIEMKRFGEPIIVHFGQEEHIAGYSLVQLIETSLISGHFANASNTAYIDIFSCKVYDPEVAAQFTADYFGGKIREKHVILRK